MEARAQPGVFDGDREIIDRDPVAGAEPAYGGQYDAYNDGNRNRYERDVDVAGQASLGVVLDPQSRRGAMVDRVVPNSAADHAGLRPGDNIVALNGRRVSSAWELTSMVDRLSPGDVVDIDFMRPRHQTTQAQLSADRSYTSRSYREDDDRYIRQPTGQQYGSFQGYDETSRLRPDPDRDWDEGLIFDRDRDARRFEVLRPRD
jgi:hypothetical protein